MSADTDISPTADGILEAITRVFAEKGYEGVRVSGPLRRAAPRALTTTRLYRSELRGKKSLKLRELAPEPPT